MITTGCYVAQTPIASTNLAPTLYPWLKIHPCTNIPDMKLNFWLVFVNTASCSIAYLLQLPYNYVT